MRHLPGGGGKRYYPGRTWGGRAEQDRTRNKVRVAGKALREARQDNSSGCTLVLPRVAGSVRAGAGGVGWRRRSKNPSHKKKKYLKATGKQNVTDVVGKRRNSTSVVWFAEPSVFCNDDLAHSRPLIYLFIYLKKQKCLCFVQTSLWRRVMAVCRTEGGGGGRENVQAESEPEMRRKEEGFAASEVQPSDLLLSCGPLCSAT